VLQSFIASKTLDQSCLSEATYSLEEMEVLKEKLLQEINSVMIR
jgi:hypothetical protein